MPEEPWVEADRREAEWDRYLATLPRCGDCGQPITDGEYLRTDDGPLCPRCVKNRWETIP